MRSDTLIHVVPNADPDFVRIIERMPEPPTGGYEAIVAALPKLHELFLAKRKAAEGKDMKEFERIVEEEGKLIGGLSSTLG